jgi:hypothetical protein
VLGFWRPYADYQKFVSAEIAKIALISPLSVLEYEDEISKLYILDTDTLKPVIAPLYSYTGRKSNWQPEIFRAFILMNMLKIPPDKWLDKLSKNPVLRVACGFSEHLPSLSSYYDFLNRIVKLDEKPRLKKKKRKPSKKYGKNQKMPPKHPNITRKFVDRILIGKRFNQRPERVLQQIFADVCVKSSIKLGLIPKNISVSGDGTCVETGASPYGVKVCGCKDFKCDCPRRFSDPNATWGWDSHNERYFYGYTGYFISTYNKARKVDLPLLTRIVDAKRHDSVSAVVALSEFRDLYPELKIKNFISDSASDNYATYDLLDKWGINAVIALNPNNKGNFKYPEALSIDENGVPICPGGNKMVYWGFCGKDRCRLKWRCPKACGKSCQLCVSCSPSSYGRVIYTKPKWDLRLFTKIPRGSERWKETMNERTAAERVNNRILNHYGIENSRQRGKKRISFFATIAAFNIHLDAQIKMLKADNLFVFKDIFRLTAT